MVKATLSEILDRVERHHERIVVTRGGRETAAILSPEDLRALEETIAILSDPATLRRLDEADAALAAGDMVDAKGLRAMVEASAAARKRSIHAAGRRSRRPSHHREAAGSRRHRCPGVRHWAAGRQPAAGPVPSCVARCSGPGWPITGSNITDAFQVGKVMIPDTSASAFRGNGESPSGRLYATALWPRGSYAGLR